LILCSDDAVKASFEVYSLFSGSKLNQSKSKGLWLGGWSKVSGLSPELNASPETPERFKNDKADEDDANLIPAELQDLMSLSGVRLVWCENKWRVDDYVAHPRKNLSVTFAIDEDITGEDILDGFDHAGFDTDKIVSIQRKILNRMWVVSFTEQEEKDQLISKGRIEIKGTVVFVGNVDLRTDIVKIFEAPDELPDTVIISCLSCSDWVLSFRRDVSIATGIRNSVRTALMRISHDNPCSIHMAGETIAMKYSSQPRSSRLSGGTGHFANDCKQPRCYNCDLPGHLSIECIEVVLCGICFQSMHPLSECLYVTFSANV